MNDPPTGTITFLFTDIEGSTRLWEAEPEAMRVAIARHDAILRETIEGQGGHVFKTVGDAFCAAFPRATDAVAAALHAQQALQREDWGDAGPLRARIALYTGEAEDRDGDYFGPPLNRCARILAAGHGGQVLLSHSAAELVRDVLPSGAELKPLGEHRLRDLTRPEPLFQLVHPDLPADFPALRSLSAFAHNLPVQLSSFVGREREMAEVKRLLGTTRLLTLTGTGGAGKTRLALQVGADLLDEYPDGVWLVELGALSEPSLVPQAALSALGLREEPQRALVDALVDSLRPKRLLLILDNCEHLVDACAGLAESLLRACPKLCILATSRETLQAEGEVVWRVPSLSLPDRQAPPPPVSVLAQYEAVRLFIERALAAKPEFRVTNDNAPAVAEICWRLDGIPLAVELAAARVNVLSPEQIQERLDDRFRLLTGGRRTALPRHQTLRAAVEWSDDLLPPEERKLLHRLAVFAGGFTLAAAEAVGAGDGIEREDVLDLLTALVDKSLVQPPSDESQPRHRLLETLRAYGRERLEAAAALAAAERRHGEHFLQWIEDRRGDFWTARQQERLAELTSEHDNVRATLAWALAHEPDRGGRVVGALGRFWELRAHWREGCEWCARYATEGSLRPEARAGVLNTASGLARLQGDMAEARRTAEEALAVAEAADDKTGISGALNGLGNLAVRQGDYAQAVDLFSRSLALRRETGDERGAMVSLMNLGLAASEHGEHEKGRALYEESLALARRTGDLFTVAAVLNNLANNRTDVGDFGTARACLEESLQIRRALGDKPGVVYCLHNLGFLAHDRGDFAAAKALYEESLALNRQVGVKLLLGTTLNNLGNLARSQADYARCRALLNEALAASREVGDRAQAAWTIRNIAAAAHEQGDYAAAQAGYEEGLGLARAMADRATEALILGDMGGLAADLGDCSRGRALLEEAVTLRRELQARPGIAYALAGLAAIVLAQGDAQGACGLCRESLAAFREIGDRFGSSQVLITWARIALSEGDPGQARALLEEALSTVAELGDKHNAARCLESIAAASSARGEHAQAARVRAAAEALRAGIGAPLPPAEQDERDRRVADLRAALGDEAFAAAWAEGEAMTVDEAVAYALKGTGDG